MLGEGSAVFLHHLDAGIHDVPVEPDAGCFQNPLGGIADLRSDAVTGNKCNVMSVGHFKKALLELYI